MTSLAFDSLRRTPVIEPALKNMSLDVAPTGAAVLSGTPGMGEEILMSLSELRAKRNFFLPVFRLSPETLATIFIHGTRDYHESDNGGRFTTRIPTWVNVSYVCSYWRNITLNYSTLWTYHFNTSLRWTEELLLRSKQALLKISCISGPFEKHSCQQPSLLDKLLKNSERIQELHLNVPPPFLPHKFSLSAPRLEKLDIKGTSVQSIRIIDGDKLPLHTLKLVACSLSWYSLNLSGLKILYLCRVWPPTPLNMVEFLAILGRTKNLTFLHLEYALPSARLFLSSGGLDVSQKINLPHLAVMVVIAPVSTVVVLLSFVDIPPRTRFHLEPLFEYRSSVGDYAPISSFLAHQFNQQSSGMVFRSLLFASDASHIPSLAFGLECKPPSLGEMDHSIPLKIILGVGEDNYLGPIGLTESNRYRIISDISHSLPLRNIQSLDIHWPVFSSNFWRVILGCLNGLRSMKLSYGPMPDLSLLSLPACASDENSRGQPIPDQDPTPGHMSVPALEELELYCIAFTPKHNSSQSHMSQKSLLDTLSTRKGLQD